ncbi:MAG: hypothetical protein LC737_08760, partial [Chloroflexi bacterium]|nr:hypothetical protein [Chloroflexota bacterium]
TNNGTFTHNSGTVVFNGTNQTISGSTNFNNLTKSVSSADTLTFQAGSTQMISGALNLQGASGQLLSLRSSVSGTQWNINPQGTRTIQYLDVKDSNNTNTSAIIATGTNSVNSGNNTNWTFGKSNQTISVTTAAPGSATYNTSFNVAASASSGLAVAITATGGCSVSSSGSNSATIHMDSGTNTCTVHYNQAGDSNYNAATEVTSNTTAQKANQTITFTGAPASAVYNTTFNVSASASSGLAVTLAASGACSISVNTVTVTSGTGTCSLTADQSGDNNYNAATQAIQSTTAQKANQTTTVSVTGPSSITYGNTGAATASGGDGTGAYVFSTRGDTTGCSVSGTTVSVSNTSGVCKLTAHRSGDNNYNDSAESAAFTVTLNKANQTITFGALANKTYGDADFTVSATASSGLAVSFSASGNCTVSGSTVHITGAGSCTITASQAGNGNYNAATNVPQSFSIAQKALTITASSHTVTYSDAAPTITPSYSGFVSG